MRFLLAMAWRNLWRNPGRSAITALAMGVAVALSMATLALQDGMFSEMFQIMVEQQLGHVQVHPGGTRTLENTLHHGEALTERLEALPSTLAVSPRVQGFALLSGEGSAVGAQLVGVDPAREPAVSPLLSKRIRGEALPVSAARRVLLGYKLAEKLQAEPGSELVVFTQGADGSLANELYTVAGIFRSGDAALDRAGAILHYRDLQELLVLGDQLHSLTLLARDKTALPAYAQQVRDALGDPSALVQTWREASPETAEMMSMQDASSGVVLGIVFVVAAFGVLNTMAMSVFERTKELGILRAVGVRPGKVVGLIVLESLLLSGVAGLGGLVLGGALDLYLVRVGMDLSSASSDGFSFAGVMLNPVIHGEVRPLGVLLILSSVVVVALLASLFPAYRAARLDPVEALRAE